MSQIFRILLPTSPTEVLWKQKRSTLPSKFHNLQNSQNSCFLMVSFFCCSIPANSFPISSIKLQLGNIRAASFLIIKGRLSLKITDLGNIHHSAQNKTSDILCWTSTEPLVHLSLVFSVIQHFYSLSLPYVICYTIKFCFTSQYNLFILTNLDFFSWYNKYLFKSTLFIRQCFQELERSSPFLQLHK